MKYIDADKLYKQVDELMVHFAELENETKLGNKDLSIFYQGKKEMCSELLGIIDSLQQEQPGANFKIEERKWVHNAVDNIFPVFPEYGDFLSEVDFRKILKATARYFYELGKLNTGKEK